MNDEEEIQNKSLDATRDDSVESDTTEVEEFEYNDDGEEDLKKTLKKLRADLKSCQKEKEEYLTGWQKERAEFANYRKGEDDRKTMFSESMREHILSRFLTVIDSFDMAFANKQAWEKVDENWRKGVEYIHSQMNTIFEDYGVKQVGTVGEAFDPSIHQSIEVVETDKKELDHTVSDVIQKGYKLGERVMRPARVNIYEYKE
ncbi:nucleotide exchange factor GrpE [Candidatus Nomurabacteria bacterium RIFCSPLOWO2_02_40_28]|uniref:Protein GrpE n=2 Tax=Candidatus Nomuraibacteriota TaxID=1752729 RepID=A0A837HUJ5_9BACT|nr:MAG: Protein GrpE [Candidatus Nomurabacteria bacterium GW2011_GWD2_39_12]KKR20883.1 MAG: Protein GrpE [Candidatus Nomurabacteria bacterium GW2011_GWC2_39_41]KKR36407.1 MAG: Protein GrpE [Candidatus Nomurabacteria bacterium GW2011_GWE2_40_10]KKR38832.1 MAG: Protein GrpE [Candidatus Nomurabacteria bacterium GW2011_GWB1_40_11]KKR40030.1 MAG: Protein GrpE [Parcubacteria group bacterium GW2011_GWC1_40_11]KKR59219.1 MAG: Protein GrpE [Candidatus Nomurabacteria bacterium GW2011_GWF2_40_31]KKR6680